MLIRDDGEAWTAITQPAHAYLAGQVARHWAPELPADVVLGVAQHDVAWMAWDREPSLHAPARRAASFIEVPMAPRLEVWRHVARRLEAQSPYAALLVALHATNIHTRYVPEESRPLEFLAQQRADQDALLAVLPDATREQAMRDAELVFALDALSLALCHGWDARDLPPLGDGTTIRFTPLDDDRATLDPWPLDVDRVTIGIDARRLRERFDDEAAMRAAMAATPHHRERVMLVRA
jgi:uncharacterized protein DUF3891